MPQIYTKLKPQFENIAFERNDNRMIINFGPQHPSAHGQMHLILELDGEMVVKATPDIGYLHRGMEKMAENMIYSEFIPTTDRMDYINSTSSNYAYVMSVEKLLGLEIPRRAEIIRMMLLELNRIVAHMFFISCHAMDVGALSIMLYGFKGREYGLDLIEDYCGARLTHSSMRIGGVPLDLPEGWCEGLSAFLDRVPNEMAVIEGLLNKNRIWRARLEGVGAISKEMAKKWALSGVMLRACGFEWDLRKAQPYSLYNEVEFDVPYAVEGDSYARYLLYMEEVRQSTRILRQLIPMYKASPPEILAHAPEYVSAPKEQIMTQNYSLMQHFVLVTQGLRPPKGMSYAPTESPKGELGFIIYSDGEPYPYRLKVRSPSFYHCGILQDLLPGQYLADVVTIIGSTNVIFGEIDR